MASKCKSHDAGKYFLTSQEGGVRHNKVFWEKTETAHSQLLVEHGAKAVPLMKSLLLASYVTNFMLNFIIGMHGQERLRFRKGQNERKDQE